MSFVSMFLFLLAPRGAKRLKKSRGDDHPFRPKKKPATTGEVSGLSASAKEELYGKSRKGKSEIKFRHPKDASLTWTGRGRKPGWLNEAVKKGAKLESFAI